MAALTFPVRRREPVLIGPASPTPNETKRLSDIADIDSKESLRVLMPGIFIYRSGGGEPVGIIRRALSEVLVHFYPLAGRLREEEVRKLVVDCTGEGVLFAEADADVRLAELEAAAGVRGLTPPFPCMEELLLDVDRSRGMLTWPLVVILVTQLLCGGFVFAMRISHAMCDAAGVFLFMSTIADLARGLPAPSVAPAWSRELLDAPTPLPRFDEEEHDAVPLRLPVPPPHGRGDMASRSFVFRIADVKSLKECLPPHIRGTATTFEVLAALLWRARAAALALPPCEVALLGIIASFRRNAALRLPAGYYGNACVPLKAAAAADELLGGSLGDVVEKVQKAKATAGHVRSVTDMLVLHGPLAPFISPNMFLVSDLRHVGFHSVDLGWGAPVYGGPSQVRPGATFFVAVKDTDGEVAVAVPVTLPRTAMERFAAEIESSLEYAA